jgi:hypothetical protein
MNALLDIRDRRDSDQVAPMKAASPAQTPRLAAGSGRREAPASVPGRLERLFGQVHLVAAEFGLAGKAGGALLRQLGVLAVVLTVTVLLGVTATSGYSASFIGLHAFAVEHMGYSPQQAWLVPVAIDGAALGMSIAAFVMALLGIFSPTISLLIVGFTSVSSWIQYQHLTDSVGRRTAALLPFVAVILLEVLLALLRRVRTNARPSHGLFSKLADQARMVLAKAAPREAAQGHLLLRAALHPVRAWRLMRTSFNLPDSALTAIRRDDARTDNTGAQRDPTAAELPRQPATTTQQGKPARPAARRIAGAANTARARRPDALDPRRQDAFAFIRTQQQTNGQLPTGAQVAATAGMSERWGRNVLDQYRTRKDGAA